VIVAMVALVVGPSGCGGDDGADERFAERGERICSSVPAEAVALAEEPPPDPDPGLDGAIAAVRQAVAELRAIDPPEGEEDVIEGALRSWEEHLDEVAAGGPVDPFVLDSAYEAHNVLLEAGLPTCAALLPRQAPPGA
jgi:hypothetical protein